MNKKRLQRLWRQADLKVPTKQRKSRRLAGSSENSVARRKGEYPGHVWSYDFAMDQTEEGRRLKFMPVVEEYTRECLALSTERSITSEQVIRTLAYLFASRGAPDYIRAGLRPRVHCGGGQGMAGEFGREDAVYRAWLSVGKRLLGDLYKQDAR